MVVVDTTCKLGGFGAKPNPALSIQDATRLQVEDRAKLLKGMLNAVQNHSPRVLIIDEIRKTEEVLAI